MQERNQLMDFICQNRTAVDELKGFNPTTAFNFIRRRTFYELYLCAKAICKLRGLSFPVNIEELGNYNPFAQMHGRIFRKPVINSKTQLIDIVQERITKEVVEEAYKRNYWELYEATDNLC